jgi:hypothetical protein
MIIQNKHDGHQESISPQKWDLMYELGFQKDWVVISNSDMQVKKTIPKEITDFNPIFKSKTHGSKRKPAISDDKAV